MKMYAKLYLNISKCWNTLYLEAPDLISQILQFAHNNSAFAIYSQHINVHMIVFKIKMLLNPTSRYLAYKCSRKLTLLVLQAKI